MQDRYVREIINGFPYPIAAMFVKLRTDECLDPGPIRLRYLLGTGETITRFLAIVNLCQARDFAESTHHSPPESLRTNFKQQFERISWGIWLGMARESLRWLLKEKAVLPIAETGPFFFKRLLTETAALKALGELVTLRNGFNHEKVKALHIQDYKKLCDQVQIHLETVLESLEFLLNYELTFISEIDVHKCRRHDPTYRHRIKRLYKN